MKTFLSIGLLLIFAQAFCAQNACTAVLIFTEQNCAGDEVSANEKELFRIINEYRAQNNLPPVALSEPLSFVANRHLLDLSINVKYLTHSWSNCPYDIKNSATWDCIFESPKRLKTNYPGQGFENLYRNLTGNATPALALEAWKKSPMHNNLILNLDVWKTTKYDAFGVAVSGNYAAIWFGSSGSQEVNLGKEIKGLGVPFGKLVDGLSTILSIEKESSLADSEKWVGKSADNTIKLEIFGKETDIAETTMSFSVKLDKKFQLTAQGKTALAQFLKNLAGDWTQREKWAETALQKISKAPKSVQTIDVGNKTILVKINAENYLTVLVKPNLKPVAKEL
jgi:uncharacterized protein YkwD